MSRRPTSVQVVADDGGVALRQWQVGTQKFISRVIGVRRHSLNTGAAMAALRIVRCALEVTMQCLWLTLADPEPATNGQLIYSKGLIEATCRAGASLAVIGLARPENPRAVGRSARGIDWRLADERRKSAGRRLLSRDPIAAQRGSPEMQHLLERALARTAMGRRRVRQHLCRLGAAARLAPSRPKRAAAAHRLPRAQSRGHGGAAHRRPLHRGCAGVLKEIDCLKVIVLERRLISAADLVTSNTPDDCRTLRGELGRPADRVPAAGLWRAAGRLRA